MSPATPRYFVNRASRGFQPPATLEEAEVQRLDLIDRLNVVNSQLSNQNRTDTSGRRLSSAEFCEWRHRAVVAKRHLEGELRHLNLWLKQQRRARTADQARDLGYDPADPMSLLLAAANVFQRLRSDGVDFDPEECAVSDAIKDLLQHGAASRAPRGPEVKP